MNDIDIIKQSVSILDIIECYSTYTVKNRKSFNILCPVHGERNPSCTIWTDTNRFKCWSCGETGSQIDLLAGMLDISFSEAIRVIRSDFNIAMTDEDIKKYQVKKTERQYLVQAAREFDRKRHQALLWLFHCNDVLDKIIAPIATMEALERIGFLLHRQVLVNRLIDMLLNDDIEIREEGLQRTRNLYRKLVQNDDS